MHDRYMTFARGLESPVIDGFAITPDDDVDLPEMTRAIYVGEFGTVSVTLASGTTITLENVASGTILPLRASRILASNTSARHMVGLV